jgi:exonuclease I
MQLRDGARIYFHRFTWCDNVGSLKRVSRRFFFHRKGIEFVAGLAWHPDGERLIVSFGVGDGESWLGTVDAADIRATLYSPDQRDSRVA